MKKGVIIFLAILAAFTGLYLLYQAAVIDNSGDSQEVIYPEINIPENAQLMEPALVSPGVDTSASDTESGALFLRYVGNSPDECTVIRFVCEENEEYFSDDMGCGCELIQ